ncbi:NUDIX domain-containing protein [Paenibacillus sp. NFR01]|uniref:NUDIX domain-containing protein n=1 Tax=Paenibacillus sp. NFR01 TaxID=1566279 RepID=UPI0008AC4083|nr:NUDIX domain-containing protein [Paenibacillus sp. NFR01]SET13351.1 ADP-ribose pyrophosphatase YjhB, NUDIX family [Paenibacillus sp. NFR01]
MPMSEYYRSLRGKVGQELLMVPSVAGVIRNENHEILLLRKSGEERWGLPAGAVEPGETPSRALRREVFEETALMVTPERVIGVFGGPKYAFRYPNGDAVEYAVTVFECRIVKGMPRSLDGEVEELRFFPEDELPQLTLPYPPELFSRESTDRRVLFE